MKTREQIVEDILRERFRQDGLYVAQVCDETNTLNDSVAYIIAYLGRAVDKCARNQKEGLSPAEMLTKAASLCVAAIESTEKAVDPVTETEETTEG